jgi:hypothetical protein
LFIGLSRKGSSAAESAEGAKESLIQGNGKSNSEEETAGKPQMNADERRYG